MSASSLNVPIDAAYPTQYKKRAFFRCEKEIDKARDKAASNGRNADKAENHVRDKHESKAEEKKLHEVW